MNTLRKLELSCGAMTAVLGMLVLLLLVREEQQAAIRLERDFPLYRSLLIGLLVFVFPSVLVFIGSYFHSVKKSLLGQFCLLAGTLIAGGIFFLLFVRIGAFYSLHFAFWIHFLLAMFAILTSVLSVFVQRQR